MPWFPEGKALATRSFLISAVLMLPMATFYLLRLLCCVCRSDFVCCQDDYNNKGPAVPGQHNTFIWSSQNSAIGSCDWAVMYTNYIDITYNIYKTGYAWATCK